MESETLHRQPWAFCPPVSQPRKAKDTESVKQRPVDILLFYFTSPVCDLYP